MFELCLKNASNDYQVFLDGEQIDIKFNSTKGIFACNDILKGKHNIKIKKNYYDFKVAEVLMFWFEALLTASVSKNIHTSITRGAYSDEYEFSIEADEDFKFVFDTFENTVEYCSGTYSNIKSIHTIDKSIKRKVDFLIKLPIFILAYFVLLPIWLISIFILFKNFSFPAILLFLLCSFVFSLVIIALVRVKKYKW